MTKEQFTKKVNELVLENNKIIREYARKLLASGCVNLESADDNYGLPKAFMHAALLSCADEFKPFDDELLKEAKNISRFI